MNPYDHQKIEQKWQKFWEEQGTYKTLDSNDAAAKNREPYYVLDMFPYPSGSGLHVGHPRGYIGSDILARQKRMEGFNVLHPMGYDAFGLPAEQFAIQNNIHPEEAVKRNIETFRGQLEHIGFSYDWSRQVNTTDPAYYKWTQWIFLNIYESYYDLKLDKAMPIADLEIEFAKNGTKNTAAVCDTDTPAFSAEEWNGFSELEKQNMLMKYRLAYEGYSEVNWCAELGTVLANDEIVEEDGKMVSERGGFPVVKKSMRQWFMRITAYADRLLAGLETIDWPNNIKEIQRNWIGKSEGSQITFHIEGVKFENFIANVDVFTTRPDTLYGVTFLALAVDHPLVEQLLKNEITNWDKVYSYIEEVKKTDRTDVKEKTGIRLEGIVAKDSLTDNEVPVFVTNYVLPNYGTGAVMGVPAHDERDFEFAKKYELLIKEVVIPNRIDIKNPPVAGKKMGERQNVQGIVRDPKTGKYLLMYSKEFKWTTFPMGGIEDNEDIIESITREIREETGYKNLKFVKVLGGPVRAEYFAAHKNENRVAYTHAVMFDLINDERVDVLVEEEGKHELLWLDKSELVYPKVVHAELNDWLARWDEVGAFVEYGILINSGEFDGMDSETAKKKITEAAFGKVVTKYKMRDAIFARQRYWGEPIPLIHRKEGMIDEVPKENLPLKLPDVKTYAPAGTGESPLATVKEWVDAGYETNTMPGWAGSSWYFIRYMDPNNSDAIAGEDEIKYWKSVDMYVGGAEHATGHLLYSRFWHKFLKDRGYVETEEPFKALRNQGMIGGADGRKMSKRWGNVINPDDVVRDMGADTLRVYESFMGPFESHLPWSIDGIVGARRFIERVWKLQERIVNSESSAEIKKIIHKTIKKISEDISNFSFNTSISAMMICLNEIEKVGGVSKEDFKKFLQVLAPFAPHITDELWRELGGTESIHLSSWPIYDENLVVDDTVKLGIQINGKVRAEIELGKDEDENTVREKVLAMDDVRKWILDGTEIKKFIYVPGKIISIVL